MIYYHFTESFLSQHKNDERFIDVLRNFFLENKEKDSLKNIGKVSVFTKSIYVFRNKSPYFEAILEERVVIHNGVRLNVYFVRALKNIKNSLQEYVDIRDGKWIEKKPFNIEDEKGFIAELDKKESENKVIEKIPDDLVSWQNSYKLKISYDIYESAMWVNYAVNNSPQDGLRIEDSKLFLNLIRNIVNNTKNGTILAQNESTVFYRLQDADFKIELLYIRAEINDKKYFILFGGCHYVEQVDYQKRINQHFSDKFNVTFNSIHHISQFCLKAYPSWTLKEDELWLNIQKNNEYGNLSLLPEQTDFLEDFTFPKYINGQAGSGKSTILYYLFSNIYYYKCAGELKGEIIFITENEKLLEHTVKSIYELVLNNPEFQLTSEDADLVNLKRHFYSFRDFLRSFLPDPELFNEEKYLDFSKFKNLYESSAINNSIKRKFSAELVWFTITTYIYGLELKEQLTSEHYDEKMPKEGKEIISKEDFQIIEKEILRPFYDKLLSDEFYWNKITLIKYLIENNLINKDFEVIFCDESQDFSKVELEFIISLSLYSNYNLEDVSQFPIVFAGDALQTVNPTGFRSEVLTSMIYKSLTDPSVGFKLNQKDLVFTPGYNYRSSPSIVSISNVVQNWRKFDLKEDIKEFQKPKRTDSYSFQNLNIFIDSESFVDDLELHKKIEYKTVIVPVNNEEITAYKEQFPILNKFNNIISSIDAKGLDFSEVVIFGFGEFFIKGNFGTYEKKYFYNKLYVAVTRTRDELIIIDSRDSKVQFWDKIIENFISTQWNKENQNIKIIDDLLVTNSNSVIQSKEDIVEDDAKQQKDIGWASQNIPLLKIASNHFLKIGIYSEYYFCLGLIEEINGRFDKATDHFLNKALVSNAEAKKRALINLWNGKNFDRLKSLSTIETKEKRVFDCLCNIYLSKNEVFDEIDIDFLDDNIKVLQEIKKNTIWIDDFKNLFKSNITEVYQKDLIHRIYEITNEVFKDQLSQNEKIEIADILYHTGQFNSALGVYNSANVRSVNFYFTLAEIAKRRKKHEEYILNMGKVIYEDFAQNKGEIINKSKIAEDILLYYVDNELQYNLKSLDPYFYAYILLSKLYINNESYFEDLEEYDKVKSLFIDEQRESELLSFFYYILEENIFTHLIFNKVIFDWASLYYDTYKSIADLNKEYKVLCEIKNLEFVPFNENFVEAFSAHINNIKVKNFKQFDELEIKNIGLINLIVGDNNIGKTSSLEMFLINQNVQEYYKRLLFSFIERSKIIPDKVILSDKVDYVYNIESSFLKVYSNYNNNLNPTFEWSAGKKFYKVNLVVDESQEQLKNFNNLNFTKAKREFSSLSLLDTLNMPFCSFGKGYGQDLAMFYDNFVRKDRELEAEFLINIQLFIPNIENVLITSDGAINIRIIGDSIDKPLFAFGDGANKLFRILILLTIHKGQILLIDEIDSGIHFSRFKKFWEIIIEIALKDSTQIIATTHNLECIEYFSSALKSEDRQHARVIQLIKTNRLKSITYDYDNFYLALENQIEIRN